MGMTISTDSHHNRKKTRKSINIKGSLYPSDDEGSNSQESQYTEYDQYGDSMDSETLAIIKVSPEDSKIDIEQTIENLQEPIKLKLTNQIIGYIQNFLKEARRRE